MTARWVVEEIGPQRDLNVTWQPISLLLKNELTEDSSRYSRYFFTHRLLRLMEAARAASGNDAVHALYRDFGRRIHHERSRDFDPADSLRGIGLDPELAAACDDPKWDDEIERRMQVGLDLAGTDIGTPIIAFDGSDGERVGIFGPVLTRVLPARQSLPIWDAVVTLTATPGFWELKRTRTERPDFGDPPLKPTETS